MATNVLHIRASSDDVRRVVAGFIAAMTGQAPQTELVRGVQLRVAMEMLSQIQDDFLTKARGGTGKDGITWKPLAKATIANRRPAPHKKKGERPIGLLTDEQDKFWRKTFACTMAMLAARGEEGKEAKAIAAKVAWARTKEMGGKTKLEVYGNRTVEILTDTGELARSFSPGEQADGQICKTEPGQIIVGTNKKTWHHKGNARLPSRPFWPSTGEFPDGYFDSSLKAARTGCLEAFTMLFSGYAA